MARPTNPIVEKFIAYLDENGDVPSAVPQFAKKHGIKMRDTSPTIGTLYYQYRKWQKGEFKSEDADAANHGAEPAERGVFKGSTKDRAVHEIDAFLAANAYHLQNLTHPHRSAGMTKGFAKYASGAMTKINALLNGECLDEEQTQRLRMLTAIAYDVSWSPLEPFNMLKGIIAAKSRSGNGAKSAADMERLAEDARIMIEVAGSTHTTAASPIIQYDRGNFLIVKGCDDKSLDGFATPAALADAVNWAFWEAIGYFAGGGQRYDDMLARYETVLKHSDLLDLSRAKEFYKDFGVAPLSAGEWVTEGYVSAFNREKSRMDSDLASNLAAPIVLNAFQHALDLSDDDLGVKGRAVEKALEPYKAYLKTEPVQKLLAQCVTDSVSAIYDEDAVFFVNDLKIYLSYLDADPSAKAELVSSALPDFNYLNKEDPKELIELRFPLELLTPKKKAEIEIKLCGHFEDAILSNLDISPDSPVLKCAVRPNQPEIRNSAPTRVTRV